MFIKKRNSGIPTSSKKYFHFINKRYYKFASIIKQIKTKKMKTNNEKKNKKFGLEKFEVAKLKNMRVIIGGNAEEDDPVDTNHKNGGSSANCGG